MTTTDAPLIAVTGATGYVGRFVVDELQERGAEVRALGRPGSDRGGFAAPIDWVEGDLRSSEALRRLVTGADAVVHLAYEHVPGRFRGGEGRDLDGWLEANVLGSLRLLALSSQADVSRFVFLSSRAVFSTTEPGRILDESHPVSPDSHYGAYKAAVEAFLCSFQSQQDMQAFAVRATGVYGLTRPVERSKWWEVVENTLDGVVITPARGGTEVYGGDVARVIWALLSRPDPNVDTIHLSDLYVTRTDVARIARRYAGLSWEYPPDSPTSPANPLACRNLRTLGIQLGGIVALESAIERLVKAVLESRATGDRSVSRLMTE